jgi:hypothetical protein
VLVYLKPELNAYILPERLWLDKAHFLITILALLAGIYTWLSMKKDGDSQSLLSKIQWVLITISILSGVLMMIKFEAIEPLVSIAYTVFDVSIVLIIIVSIIYLINNQFVKNLRISNL